MHRQDIWRAVRIRSTLRHIPSRHSLFSVLSETDHVEPRNHEKHKHRDAKQIIEYIGPLDKHDREKSKLRALDRLWICPMFSMGCPKQVPERCCRMKDEPFRGLQNAIRGQWLKMLCLFVSFALAPQRRGVDAEYAGSLIEADGRGHYGDDVFFFHLFQ